MQINIKNACKNYEGKVVLNVAEFTFKTGKIYAILGLNGSGKSTLLNCIAGICNLSSGNIVYNEELKLDDIRKSISIVSQKPYLFNSSVRDNIVSGLRFRKMSNDDINKRLTKYTNYFSIDKLLNKNSKKLSGGEGAKAAMLRTIVLETDVVLLDEPTAAMDVESTLEAEKLIKSIVNGNKTVIMVTHDLYQAERVADYVIFMDKGKIIEHGTKEKVFKYPEHPLVRTILNRGN